MEIKERNEKIVILLCIFAIIITALNFQVMIEPYIVFVSGDLIGVVNAMLNPLYILNYTLLIYLVVCIKIEESVSELDKEKVNK